MKSKKIPYYLLLLLLTVGASLILGFLSFGGMFVLWPVLPLAFGAFFLSVAYEYEIYMQNITGALGKLGFKRDYLERHLAREFLLNNFPKEGAELEGGPEFFRDYKKMLQRLHALGEDPLDEAGRLKKKKIEKKLSDMEKWFAEQLFAKNDEEEDLTPYQQELRQWLKTRGQDEVQELFTRRRLYYRLAGAFSILAGLFMGAGTTYLLVGEFAAIPLLAAIPFSMLPAFIIPMAVIAGAAYGFLTYNAITDMINNDTLRQWYIKIRDNLVKEVNLRSLFLAVTSVLLVGLAIALTICTAGTWWTVVKNSRPLFAWMGKIPVFVMGIINPIITGLSAVFFNLENTSNTFEIIDGALKSKKSWFREFINDVKQGWAELRQKENWLQIINPFRLVINILLAPLRLILFLGHLISIGVTSDRVPGIPETVSAGLGTISELGEDWHYFFPGSHEHKHDDFKLKHALKDRLSAKGGHSHDNDDAPTVILKFLLSPVFLLATLYAWGASQFNNPNDQTNPREVLTFKQAWYQQTGRKAEQSEKPLQEPIEAISEEWEIEHTLYKVDNFQKKHFSSAFNSKIVKEKTEGLDAFQKELRQLAKQRKEFSEECAPKLNLKGKIEEEAEKSLYNKHRFFEKGDATTKTFLQELPQSVCAA
ncbi:hypothetical protein Lqui_1064 [Legionella quinlivanii]|uniref:Uncharacterized protein n=1 Tax=Legionella quinlivanii TaxID=45073 RepID=A0A0W0Y5F3_9GAMM|nr:hypothetical protein [Legionella quinlivanii]KTD52220.1 hypothetical protein Lqui_1064 [Legionella quinlivanii]SEF75333.1 hypothetical protein SAMN02746093_00989 [Legionella quinlivanii DSM 21216]STY12281.1 Uncharacterised protein [Legionella quinlivanii]